MTQLTPFEKRTLSAMMLKQAKELKKLGLVTEASRLTRRARALALASFRSRRAVSLPASA